MARKQKVRGRGQEKEFAVIGLGRFGNCLHSFWGEATSPLRDAPNGRGE
jgi:hypothetical protein